jgi:acetyl esterase
MAVLSRRASRWPLDCAGTLPPQGGFRGGHRWFVQYIRDSVCVSISRAAPAGVESAHIVVVSSRISSGLDPQAQDVLDVMAAMALPPIHTLQVADARSRMRAALVARREASPMHGIEDIAVPTPHGPVTLRVYRPRAGTLPVAAFFHGGGFTVNDIDTHDTLCRRLAMRSGWLLASLQYRRAPEHRHPAALADAYCAYHWLLDNSARIGGDQSRVALFGESSGGTMAATLTMLLRDTGALMPRCQILAYPLMDDIDTWPSYAERGSGYMLDRELVAWFRGHYLPKSFDSRDPYLFPLAARDFGGLSPAVVMTAEFDPLRDEGKAYAERLAGAGVSVEHIHAQDQMHGFLMLTRTVARAGELADRLADALAAAASTPFARRD